MGALASLETRMLPVTPGAQATAEIRIRNTGTVVDQLTFEVLGDAAAWATVDPPTVSLFPGAEERARVVFDAPRSSSVPAGPMPFGVRVISSEDPAGSVVEEGSLEIAPYADPFAELAPRTSRGSRGAAHDLAVDNRGNARFNADVAAFDPDQLLEFDVQPPGLVVEPGTAGLARVRVTPRQRFWRGQPKTRPFRVQLEAAGQPPFGVDGTLLQEPILPPWLMKVLAALLALLVLAILAWIFFLRPTIESAAQERAEDILEAAGIPIPEVPGGGGGGGGGGESPAPAPSVSLAPGETAPPVTPSTPPLPGGNAPADGRLAASGSSFITVPDGRTLFITDLVFANPAAEAGPLQLQRAGSDVLVLQLENFRDLDFHFVTPIVVRSGEELRLVCACTGAAVYYSGYER